MFALSLRIKHICSKRVWSSDNGAESLPGFLSQLNGSTSGPHFHRGVGDKVRSFHPPALLHLRSARVIYFPSAACWLRDVFLTLLASPPPFCLSWNVKGLLSFFLGLQGWINLRDLNYWTGAAWVMAPLHSALDGLFGSILSGPCLCRLISLVLSRRQPRSHNPAGESQHFPALCGRYSSVWASAETNMMDQLRTKFNCVFVMEQKLDLWSSDTQTSTPQTCCRALLPTQTGQWLQLQAKMRDAFSFVCFIFRLAEAWNRQG